MGEGVYEGFERSAVQLIRRGGLPGEGGEMRWVIVEEIENVMIAWTVLHCNHLPFMKAQLILL